MTLNEAEEHLARAAAWKEGIFKDAERLPKLLKDFFRKKVPNKKPYLKRLTLTEKGALRKILSGQVKNFWYYLGEEKDLCLLGPGVYGPDKHAGSLRSYCVLHNDVREAALVCFNLERQFPGKVKCYCIPYVENLHSTFNAYLWIRIKVLFNH